MLFYFINCKEKDVNKMILYTDKISKTVLETFLWLLPFLIISLL